jgi:SAM-dependent methyltransferase
MLRIESRIIGGARVSATLTSPDAAAGRPPPDAPPPVGGSPVGSGSPAAADPPVAADPQAQPEPASGPPPPGADPGPPPGDAPTPGEWATWLASPPGQYVLDWEQAHFDAAVADVFGFHAVQCGEPTLDALRANRMPHRVLALREHDARPASAASVLRIEHFEELPFESQSLDLVVLPHVLEFAHDPHQVLREVDRVLRPEGRLVVSGFNPISLWGARQLAPRPLGAPFLPREGHFIGVPRLRDWCKLLSFDLERARYGCWRPPCRTQLWLDRTRFMERAGDRWWPICGAVYMMSAVKRVRAMRLIGPAWKKKPAPRALAVPTAQRTGLGDDRR